MSKVEFIEPLVKEAEVAEIPEEQFDEIDIPDLPSVELPEDAIVIDLDPSFPDAGNTPEIEEPTLF